MAKKTINLGVTPDGEGGDDIRSAFTKTNENFSELYTDKADKEEGKQLSDENYTLAEKNKLAGIADEATKNRADSENADKEHTHQASDITDLDTAIESKIVGELGQSETVAVSQKAVTDALSLMTPIANNIGVAGQIGFGVGICPLEYDGMSEMLGTRIFGHDNYGNYQYSDGSVMAWVPAYFYRYGHPNNPTYATYGVNSIHVLPRHAYPTVLAAAVAGYALHRAFYDDGVEQPGFFHDKYLCSNNDGIASSIKNGNAITSSAAHYPFNGLTGSPSNNFSGAIAAAKTRGDDYFPSASFLFDALAKLSLAHAQASTSSAACAWYDSTGVSNFPKGCNNNALGDAQDSSIEYESTGHETYDKAGLTGSAQPFNKTTHNGQACGIADLNGLLWEILVGVTILDGSYYILKKEARMADLTAGVTLDTDAWGAAGLAKNYTELGPDFGALGTKSDRAIGSASQVFSSETEGLEWEAACSGIPLAGGMGGTNLFGNDRLYDTNMPEHMCIAAGGSWSRSVSAGVWARTCDYSRANSYNHCGFRSALYLVKRSDSE